MSKWKNKSSTELIKEGPEGTSYIFNKTYKTLSHVKSNFKIIYEIDVRNLEDAEREIENRS